MYHVTFKNEVHRSAPLAKYADNFLAAIGSSTAEEDYLITPHTL